MDISGYVVCKRGFTLIEILVALGIVAVLGAILYPVYQGAREKGRAAACLSNYRQIGLALQMYASDNENLTPSNGGSFSGLVAACMPYAPEQKIFQCPDDCDMVKEGRPGSYRVPTLYQSMPIDCGWVNPYGNRTTHPSSTTMVYEAEQDLGASIKTTYRHSGGTQFLYFDGHTKWLKDPNQEKDQDTDGD